MPTEIEAKIKLTELQANKLAKKLNRKSSLVRHMEVNVYFDKAGDLTSNDKALRFRKTCNMSATSSPEQAFITYKGPVQSGRYKSREEIEISTDLQTAHDIARIFRGVGLQPNISFCKLRHEWKIGKCTICVDYLPYIGYFLEVEGKTSRQVTDMLKTLGVKSRKFIKMGYPMLLNGFLVDNSHILRGSDEQFMFQPNEVLPNFLLII